jgi:predicted nucleic acid-binding protein
MLSEEPDALDKFMTNITSLMTLKIVETTMHQEKQILEIAINSEMDLDEGVQYLVAKRENIEKIISYDTDFDRTDLKRVEYGELVE